MVILLITILAHQKTIPHLQTAENTMLKYLNKKLIRTVVLICLFLQTSEIYAQSPESFRLAIAQQSINLNHEQLLGTPRQKQLPPFPDFGDFKVFGIGEQSHGTSEFIRAKTRLISFLSAKYKINKIGLEAPMAEVAQLNAYLLDGKPALTDILKSFQLYNYECKEFTELVEMVKEINRKNPTQISFFGFDFQSPYQTLQNLSAYSKTRKIPNTDSIAKIIGYYKQLDYQLSSHTFSPEDFQTLNAMSKQFMKPYQDLQTKDSALDSGLVKNIKNYQQFLLLNDPEKNKHDVKIMSNTRDSLMAENVLAEVTPGSKIILLAHNGHIQKTRNPYSKAMGLFLKKKLGAAYKSMGMSTSEGFYTAYNDQQQKVSSKNPIQQPLADSFEYYFSRTHKPAFLLNTRLISTKNIPANRYRFLPFGYTDKQFQAGNILADFDYILHINKTTGTNSFYVN